jgi:hypothetical protein
MTRDEYEKLPPYIKRNLEAEGVYPAALEKVSPKGQPYTNMGVMNSPEYSMPLGGGTQGVTFRPENPELPTSDRSSFRVYNKRQIDRDPKEAFVTRAHEAEHALSGQGRGAGAQVNAIFDDLVGNDGADRGYIVERLVKNSDYLVKNWGLSPTDAKKGYFSPLIYEATHRPYNMLYEQFATLSALEQQTGKRLTADPYVRKHILKTPAEREAYEAVTGLRQTRLDAKDPAPYTRMPGSTATKEDPDDPGFMAKIKSMLGLRQSETKK